MIDESNPLEESDTGRLEAFSDGVFAVAITLLALDIHVPKPDDVSGHLLIALEHEWPAFVAYVLSFLTILIMWVNHHMIFRHINRADRIFLLLNGFLLLVVTAIPFATALLAQFLQHPDNRIAMVIYSVLSLLMALTYNLMWRYASKESRLLKPSSSITEIEAITKQYSYGPLVYLVTVVIAFVNADVSLAITMVLAIYFAIPSQLTHPKERKV